MNDYIVENKEYLTDLDREIGDGDHGINMARGFEEVMKVLDPAETDIGAALKKSAMVLISKVGGASGPLYGTAFLRAAGCLTGRTTLDAADFSAALDAAIGGIQMRGRAQAGEKTMLDALLPARDAFAQSVREGKDFKESFNELCTAAENGVEYTKTIPATKGRASYLRERSIGHIDPGAASALLLLRAIRDSFCQKDS